ncbi:hypothetical protein DF212_00220 [Lactobacillus johnsonii]|nr:hypothetical protein DF212_00220 [Lactobacillus johnsonii]
MIQSNNITRFLNKLTYWQTINLYITLLQARSDISYTQAKEEAIVNWDNPEKLKYLLEESLNSPSPKRK